MPSTLPETAGLCPDLLEILACPRCRGPVEPVRRSLPVPPDPAGQVGLACSACRVVYPVREGIPVMLVEEAIAQSQWNA